MKSDLQLQKDVTAELAWTPSVKSAHIGVEVVDGIVTLSGHVGSYAEKWETERAAQRVSGVKALVVAVAVKLPDSHLRTDGDIAQAAEHVLEWLTYLPKNSIHISVENGWITLSGTVDWEYQRQAAGDAVRLLKGVTGVSDQINIAVQVSPTAVKTDIEAALKRRAQADAKRISVAVAGGDVTLTGTVHSWSERELANHSAWGTAGVRNVFDQMVVSD